MRKPPAGGFLFVCGREKHEENNTSLIRRAIMIPSGLLFERMVRPVSTFFGPGILKGSVTAPASKSEAHRSMICAGLTRGVTRLENFTPSADTRATARCLEALGAHIEENGSVLTVDGAHHRKEMLPVFDCGESGSTLRFFVPLALILCGGGIFRMHGRLGQRPMDVYRELFVPRGVQWHMGEGADGAAELMVAGQMKPGEYVLPGSVSSQFVSGLLLALPLLSGSSRLRVLPPVESAGYIRMTLQALEQSGITIRREVENVYEIPGAQHYQAMSGKLQGDWSQAAVLFCAGALGSDIRIQGLSRNTTQGDAAILADLEQMGARVLEDDGICVQGGNLHGVDLDMRDTPDIAPMLALVCQMAEGESRLRGCGRLRLKECDRLAGTVDILNRLGGNAREDGDDMVIQGVASLKGGCRVDVRSDHRMVMLASIAATVCEQSVEVEDTDALNKSWPEYLRVFADLGGRLS